MDSYPGKMKNTAETNKTHAPMHTQTNTNGRKNLPVTFSDIFFPLEVIG